MRRLNYPKVENAKYLRAEVNGNVIANWHKLLVKR